MDAETLEAMVAMTIAEGTLADAMGIRIVSASAAEVVATMPVAGNVQPFGLLHGGASCVLAETVGSLGAALHAGPRRRSPGVHVAADLPDRRRGARCRALAGDAALHHETAGR